MCSEIGQPETRVYSGDRTTHQADKASEAEAEILAPLGARA
jgi:hypothetical protein